MNHLSDPEELKVDSNLKPLLWSYPPGRTYDVWFLIVVIRVEPGSFTMVPSGLWAVWVISVLRVFVTLVPPTTYSLPWYWTVGADPSALGAMRFKNSSPGVIWILEPPPVWTRLILLLLCTLEPLVSIRFNLRLLCTLDPLVSTRFILRLFWTFEPLVTRLVILLLLWTLEPLLSKPPLWFWRLLSLARWLRSCKSLRLLFLAWTRPRAFRWLGRCLPPTAESSAEESDDRTNHLHIFKALINKINLELFPLPRKLKSKLTSNIFQLEIPN